jgi:hypothetical protein
MICFKCQIDKSEDQYTPNSRMCMECRIEYNRSYQKTNRARLHQHYQKRKAERHRIVHEAKNRPCADCGNRYPHYVMDFDHLGDKKFTIAGKQTSLDQLREEIAKCEVVCANCHRERTWQRVREKENGQV